MDTSALSWYNAPMPIPRPALLRRIETALTDHRSLRLWGQSDAPWRVSSFLLLALLLAACRPARPTQPPTPSPTPETLACTACYYLDSVHGSDANVGTSADAPWRTLAPLQATQLPPGAIVHLKRGSRWEGGLLIDDSGQADRPIRFTAYGQGEPPTFTNPGDADHWTQAIVVDADWIIIEGVLVRDAYEAGIYLTADAEHNIIRDVEATAVGSGIVVAGRYNLVTKNYLHDLHMVVNTPGGKGDFGAVGVKFYGSYNEASYNRMERCLAPSYDYGVDGGGVEFYGETDGNRVHHNWVAHSAGFLEVGGGTARDTLVSYNVSVDNGRFSYIHLEGRSASLVENFRVEHNTIVEVAGQGPGWAVFGFGGEPTEATFSLRNNIVYVQDLKYVSNAAGFAHDHNLYYLAGETVLGFALGQGEVIADPRFADLAAGDLRLAPGSPAIDAAADLGYDLDFRGEPVPIGSAPDLGAFEFQNKE